jgi:hypothetical protein
MAYLVAGPFVALVGIVAVFFVLRRKSVEKRSMYSARRSQIEHKVRAARQRTLAPHGRAQKPQEETIPAATSTFATQAPRANVTWETPAYQAPPVAPPTMPPPPPAPQDAPWDVPAAASAPAPTFDYPPAPPEPASTPPPSEPFRPAPEPTPMAPSEPAWTPAPAPAVEPAAQMEPAAATAASATSGGGWSVVNTAKESAGQEPNGKKKKKDKGGDATATGSWQLASGDSPGAEADEPDSGRSSGTVMAVAQYAVLVVGLVMVLIGVLVMVANSHVT